MQVGDIVKVITWCQQGQQAGLMVSYWEAMTLPSPTVADQAVLDAISGTLAPKIIALMAPSASYLGAIMYHTQLIPLPAAVYSTRGAGAGTATGDPLPGQVCGIFTQRTALAGRANRGRKYVPFPSEADNEGTSNGKPTADYKTRLQQLANYFVDNVTFEDPDNPGVEYELDPIIMGPGGVPRGTCTSVVARPVWATQRRRGSYGRTNIPPF